MSELADLKNRNMHSIDKLNDNVERLNQICNDQDQSLKNLDFEKNKLQKRYEDLSYENSNNVSKLKSTQDSLSYTRSQLEEANKKISLQQVSDNYCKSLISFKDIKSI